MKLLDIIFENEDKDKLIKKGKTIYKGLKTGVLRKGLFGKIMYELPDECDVQIDINDDIFIKVGRNRTENEVKFYYVNGSGGKFIPYILNNNDYRIFVREIERKNFKSFGIVMWYEPNEGLVNEDINNFDIIENDPQLKKVYTVNKALRNGYVTLKYDYNEQETNKRYRYELPQDCKPYLYSDRLSIRYPYGGNRTDSIGDRFPLKIYRDLDGKEVLLNNHITNHDFDYIEDNLENTMFSYIFVKIMNRIKEKYDDFGIFLDLNIYYKNMSI
jgi:hypothetical protein